MLYVFVQSVHCDEIEDRNTISESVRLLFINEKFSELDRLAEEYSTTQARTNSGVWKLSAFYVGLGWTVPNQIQGDFYWDATRRKINKWIRLNPGSPSANIFKGNFLTKYAWKIRGTEFANKVPKTAWKPFKEQLGIAYRYMHFAKWTADRDPHWFKVLIDIHKGLNTGDEAFLKHVNEGMVRHPYYYDLYFSSVQYLLPRWYGNKNKLDALASLAARLTKEHDGMGAYARVYWYASQIEYDGKTIDYLDIDWAKMRQVMLDVYEQYPNEWNVQNFANISCIAKDHEMTKFFFERMEQSMLNGVWKGWLSYKGCKDFAMKKPKKMDLSG